MFSLARRRREAERQKKLDELFSKADQNGNGRITYDQMIKIYQDAEVVVPDLEDEVAKLPDKDGWILYTEFMKFAITTELCKIEFQDRVFQKVNYGEEEKKKKKERLDPSKMDRVELAFRKFDLNQDGYLTRDEFDLMMKNVDKRQADRIFRSCDTSGDDKISLEEFRNMLAKAEKPKE